MSKKSLLDELKAEEDRLRGIRSGPHEGKGYNFKVASRRKEKARKDIYDENMKSERSEK